MAASLARPQCANQLAQESRRMEITLMNMGKYITWNKNKLQYDDNKSIHHKIRSIFFKTFFIYKIFNCIDLSGRRDFVESAMKGIKNATTHIPCYMFYRYLIPYYRHECDICDKIITKCDKMTSHQAIMSIYNMRIGWSTDISWWPVFFLR